MRSQLARPLIVAAIAIAFFFAPIGLRAVGFKAHCCPENRPFAPAPKLADGWKVFDETTRYLIDRMPGRKQAIRANTSISRKLFATTPRYGQNAIGGVADDQALPFTGRPAQDKTDLNAIQPSARATPPKLIGDVSPVADGNDGWLYLQHDFDHACHEFTPLPRAMAQWLGFMKLIRASGRRVVLVVPADKSTIYPEHVRPDTPELACSRPGKARLWAAIDSPTARQSGIIGLRGALRAAKAANPGLIYYRKDSHWNPIGALTLVRSVVPALDPDVPVLAGEAVDTGPAPHTGDLTALIGAPQTETAPTRAIRRAAGAPVIGGRSLLIGDSFSDAASPLLAPYFADLRHVNWDDRPGDIITQLNAAQTVVLEVVEWQFDFYPTKYGALNPTFQRLVAQQLRRR
jgi:alginate O-acetyltransferase complex protein AlgJ